MNPPRRRARAVVLALPGLIAFVLGFVVASRSADAPATAAPLARALEHADELDPLSAAHGIAGLERPGPEAATSPPAARGPEDLARAVAERITLVPYEGAMASPAQALESGVANGVDRARLLAVLLAQAGHEARVVQVPRGDDATLRHAHATARLAGAPSPELSAALAARIDALAPRAWSRVSRERAWIDDARRVPRSEQRGSWVQVRRAGAWVDLLQPDTVVSADARRRAAPFDAATSAWTVTMRVTNVWTDGAEDEALTFDAPAEALHARSLSYTNLPDRTLRRFVPTLVVGERRVEGAAFDLSPERDLARQLLHVEVTGPGSGPGGMRRATRVLVGPRGPANEPERALEVATLARVLVLTGPVGDATHADAVARTLAHAAGSFAHGCSRPASTLKRRVTSRTRPCAARSPLRCPGSASRNASIERSRVSSCLRYPCMAAGA